MTQFDLVEKEFMLNDFWSWTCGEHPNFDLFQTFRYPTDLERNSYSHYVLSADFNPAFRTHMTLSAATLQHLVEIDLFSGIGSYNDARRIVRAYALNNLIVDIRPYWSGLYT